MNFQIIELTFVIDKDFYNYERALQAIKEEVQRFSPGEVKDVDCGEIEIVEAVEQWGVSPDYKSRYHAPVED